MNKRILILLFVSLACCSTIASCSKKSAEPTAAPTVLSYTEQYDLGVRYLTDGNYEEAIIAFTAAIEIDSRTADAYLGLADAYVGTGDMEKAMEILRSGLEKTGDKRLERAITDLTINTSLTEERYAMLTDLWTAFQTEDPQQVTDRMDTYDSDFLEALTQSFLVSGKHRRPAFDGSTLHVGWTGIGMVVFGSGSTVYYGDLVDGVPHGHGIMFTITAVYANGGIGACWCESGWEDGKALGEARLRDYYSATFYENRDPGTIFGQDISCVFGMDEIMTQAQVTVWTQNKGEEHRATYQVVDGKVVWDLWGVDYDGRERTMPCEVHTDCGVEYSTRNAGQELYQNTRSRWTHKDIPRELQHHMNYGLHLSGG